MKHRVFNILFLLTVTSCQWRDALLRVRDGGSPISYDSGEIDMALEAPISSDVLPVCLNRPKLDAGTGLGENLLIWYRCETVWGTMLPDSSGRGHHGTLSSGAGVSADSATSITTGKVGNALALNYNNKGYVTLPQGLLANACEVTVAMWVYINSNANAWTRLWDFGQDTIRYMFMTPITNTDNISRFSISISGNQNEETMKGPAPLPTLTWTHVAVVLDPSGGTLYLDGEPVQTNPTIVLRPPDLGPTVNNYIGRSQFSDDPYLDASIDEFRLYDRALSHDEVKGLLTAP